MYVIYRRSQAVCTGDGSTQTIIVIELEDRTQSGGQNREAVQDPGVVLAWRHWLNGSRLQGHTGLAAMAALSASLVALSTGCPLSGSKNRVGIRSSNRSTPAAAAPRISAATVCNRHGAGHEVTKPHH